MLLIKFNDINLQKIEISTLLSTQLLKNRKIHKTRKLNVEIPLTGSFIINNTIINYNIDIDNINNWIQLNSISNQFVIQIKGKLSNREDSTPASICNCNREDSTPASICNCNTDGVTINYILHKIIIQEANSEKNKILNI